MKKCSYCAEKIQDEAIVCRYCGRDLIQPVAASTPPTTSQTSSERPRIPTSKAKRSVWATGAIWAAVITILAAIGMIDRYQNAPYELIGNLTIGLAENFIVLWLVCTLFTWLWRRAGADAITKSMIIFLFILLGFGLKYFSYVIANQGIMLSQKAILYSPPLSTETPVHPCVIYDFSTSECIRANGSIRFSAKIINNCNVPVSSVVVIGMFCGGTGAYKRNIWVPECAPLDVQVNKEFGTPLATPLFYQYSLLDYLPAQSSMPYVINYVDPGGNGFCEVYILDYK